MAETAELPKTIVRRVVKDKLSEAEVDLNVHKEALTAFTESGRIFIHYLSATANDICKGAKRQTINADDVLQALDDIEFPELVEPLRDALEGLREKNAGKKGGSSKGKEAKTKEAKKSKEVKKTKTKTKKRKLEELLPKEDEEEEEENQEEEGGDGTSE